MDISDYPIDSGRYLIEASAGTGKTYTITHLVLRLIQKGVPVERILVTTFSKAAAAELKDRILKLLNEAFEKTDAESTREKVFLRLASSSIDGMTIGTIHSFCQKMLREFALESGRSFDMELVPDDSKYLERIVRSFCRERFYGPGAKDVGMDYERCRKAASYASQEIDLCNGVDGSAEKGAYLYAREHLEDEKRKDGAVSFDDLVSAFYDALHSPSGESLVEKIRARYTAVFVDEFQDTDRRQYSIFDKCFPKGGSTLFYMIGDPKQAIYGFRGADVYTYLEAKKTADKSFPLARNYRSSPEAVRAVNMMFGGEEAGAPGDETDGVFLQNNIPYVTVEAGKASGWFPEGEEQGGSLRLRHFVGKKEICEPLIYRDVVREIRWLLSDACRMRIVHEVENADGVKEPRESCVHASDIAILVQKNEQAGVFVQMLNACGIAASACKSGKIYDTPEAKIMLLLLRCILHPDARHIRGLLLSPFFRIPADELDNNPSLVESLLEKLKQRGADWTVHGLPAAFLGFLDEPGADGRTPRERILSEPNGERAITNYLHLMELLFQEESGEHLLPEDVLAVLNHAVNGHAEMEAQATTEGASDDNPDQLRLDRDSASVQILTMFAAKGLEFPIVFIPFPALDDWHYSLKNYEIAYKVKDDAGHIILDFTRNAESQFAARQERLRSSLRLLYVALTRATQATYLYTQQLPEGAHPRSMNYAKSAQGILMMDRKELRETWQDGRIWSEYLDNGSNRASIPGHLAPWCEALIADHAGRWDVFAFVQDDRTDRGPCIPRVDEDGGQPIGEMDVLQPPKPPEPWRVMSFSSFESMFRNRKDREAESPADHRDSEPGKEPVSLPGSVPERSRTFRDFPCGPRAGTVVHKALELLCGSFSSFRQGADANRLMERFGMMFRKVLVGGGFEPDDCMDALFDGMVRTLGTPLPGIGIPLSQVQDELCTPEMEFFLNAPESLDLEEIVSILKSTASAQARDLANDYQPGAGGFAGLRGMLNGVIDLIFEHGGKYYIVDWKTNRLGNADADYAPVRIAEAMRDNLYLLQYHLYSAALLRLLRSRGLGDDAFGGVYYLFLRGLEPTGTNGIWQDAPPPGCLNSLLDLFQKGGEP